MRQNLLNEALQLGPYGVAQVTPSRSFVRVLLALAIGLGASVASAQPETAQSESSHDSRLRVYAYTLKHQPAHEALQQVRPLLSGRGTVEVQPGGNTLVIRETQSTINRVARLLKRLDHPPEELRFDIRIVRAGPKRNGVSPPQPAEGRSLGRHRTPRGSGGSTARVSAL